MKLVTYQSEQGPRLGWLADDWIRDVGWAAAADGGPPLPADLATFLQDWDQNLSRLQRIAAQQTQPGLAGRGMAGRSFAGRSMAAAEARLLSPLPQPRTIRDFYAFEAHVQTARARRGLGVVPEWYELPVFYFSNPNATVGPAAHVARPRYTQWLDYELEIAFVIGKEGRNIAPAQAQAYIAGYLVMNDFSARDIQRQEMKVGLGPAKGKDFATGLGPYLVTADDLSDRLLDGPLGHRYDLTMTARVNGVELSRGNLKDIYFSLGELVAQASMDVTLYPGDVIGTGTVGTGCLLELGAEEEDSGVRWLQPGDVVELEVERLGVLTNRIV